eukprot:4996339-Prymnesium_polylepis.1
MLGAHVWCKSDETCWARAEVTFSEGDKLSVYIEDTDELRQDVPAASVCEIDPTHNVDLADIVAMNNLHEAPILHLLRRRLEAQQIYTWAGTDVLISVNPYHDVPLYGTDRCRELATAEEEAAAPDEPHVYTLARKAHRDLLRASANHSIVISGESGAGKTEASKRVIEYLAFASKRSREPPPGLLALRTPIGGRTRTASLTRTPGSRARPSVSAGGRVSIASGSSPLGGGGRRARG